MKWLPRKRRAKHRKTHDSKAVNENRAQLHQIRSKWPEIEQLVQRLGDLNGENHFTQLITEAMQGGRR